MQRRWCVRLAAVVSMLPLLGALAFAEQTAPDHAGSPTPAATPVARSSDPASGAPEVGIGRATGSVKGSGDEGGTAAGMPNKGPAH